jgi:hypothetical protein
MLELDGKTWWTLSGMELVPRHVGSKNLAVRLLKIINKFESKYTKEISYW